MRTLEFLTAGRERAERQLQRVRRLQEKMRTDLEQTGLDEVAVYERLAAQKAHRQLQRDEAFYQQMWLRINRHLLRHQPKADAGNTTPVDIATKALNLVAQQALRHKPQTVRYTTPPPGRNQLCPCGSLIKYKRCCGDPLKQQSPRAA
jgi:uncharacterized protein YecA (UPF0149 family)